MLHPVEILSSVERIGQNAFHCSGLSEIVFHEGLKIINSYAFAGTQLKEVVFPSTVETIVRNAFGHNVELKQVDLSKCKMERLDDYVFENCDALEEVKLPETIKYIGIQAFNNCRNLETVDIRGEKLQNIGTMCFGRCHSIDKISIRSAQVVESYAFDFYNETKNFAKLFRKSQIAYKGFNKDATGISCKLHYYTPFRKETCENPEMCIRGFHACMNPLSVFNYYAGTKKEYRKVFLEGKICNSENADTKVCAGEITVSDKIDISEMCRIYSNAPKYTVPLCVSKTIERFISFVHRR